MNRKFQYQFQYLWKGSVSYPHLALLYCHYIPNLTETPDPGSLITQRGNWIVLSLTISFTHCVNHMITLIRELTVFKLFTPMAMSVLQSKKVCILQFTCYDVYRLLCTMDCKDYIKSSDMSNNSPQIYCLPGRLLHMWTEWGSYVQRVADESA